jgi:hypothetical protein
VQIIRLYYIDIRVIYVIAEHRSSGYIILILE